MAAGSRQWGRSKSCSPNRTPSASLRPCCRVKLWSGVWKRSADVSEDKIRIDTPTQNLESYFLGVVEQARESAAETSGATSGSRVAAYLRGEAQTPSPSDKILERLTQPGAALQPVVITPKPEETVDVRKLEELAKPKETAPTDTAVQTSKPVDLEKANEKLSSLLDKPK